VRLDDDDAIDRHRGDQADHVQRVGQWAIGQICVTLVGQPVIDPTKKSP